MWPFSSARIEGFPTRYSSKETPVTVDVTIITFITLFVTLGIAYVCIIPSYSKKRSIYMSVKVLCSLLIGCSVIVENFGQEWEVGYVNTTTPYRAGIEYQIKALIGIKIGLRSVNITLQGEGPTETALAKETINYNERFSWTWDQGKFGFGPQSGLLQRSFREAQRRGVPIPILWVAEYFTIDGEGIRFGRFYRTAGWYCHILLWTAFAAWLWSNIFLQTVGRYAAYLLAITGGLQLLSCLVWVSVHNPTPLVIPFEDGIIRVQLGLHFWMTFLCGVLCILLALIIIFMDLRYPEMLSEFLGIDPLNEYDECVVRYAELRNMQNQGKINTDMEMTAPRNSQSLDNDGMVVLKRRSTIRNAQRSLFRPSIPVKIENTENREIYENAPIPGPSKEDCRQRSAKKDDYKPALPKKVRGVKVVP